MTGWREHKRPLPTVPVSTEQDDSPVLEIQWLDGENINDLYLNCSSIYRTGWLAGVRDTVTGWREHKRPLPTVPVSTEQDDSPVLEIQWLDGENINDLYLNCSSIYRTGWLACVRDTVSGWREHERPLPTVPVSTEQDDSPVLEIQWLDGENINDLYQLFQYLQNRMTRLC